MSLDAHPQVTLKRGADRRLRRGHPWVFSNEIENDPALKNLAAGALVTLCDAAGRSLGTYGYNRRTLIAARRLSAEPDATIDKSFFARRLTAALGLREGVFGQPFYRLVHAEADGLPGLIIDRFGPVLVLQINCALMELLREPLIAALQEVIQPEAILLRNDLQARTLEGLDERSEWIGSQPEGPVVLREGEASFLADLSEGQKTGWFYDQRANRQKAAALLDLLPQGSKVLDAYTFGGGFAIQAARAGAGQVLALDRSQRALDLAAEAAKLNGLAERIAFRKTDVFAGLEHLDKKGERFGLVIADPPAFIKNRKDKPQGLRGYRKLVRLAAPLVEPGGFLVVCSCSHHAAPEEFSEQVARGLQDSGRSGRILWRSGADSDHPLHPQLAESAYLKAEAVQIDPFEE